MEWRYRGHEDIYRTERGDMGMWVWKQGLSRSVNTNSTVCLSLVLPVQVWSGYGGRCTSL